MAAAVDNSFMWIPSTEVKSSPIQDFHQKSVEVSPSSRCIPGSWPEKTGDLVRVHVGALPYAGFSHQHIHVDVLPYALANAGPAERRELLGEYLYPLVSELERKMAPKVTAILLELDPDEVLYLLESPEALKDIVADAMEVLRNFSQEQRILVGDFPYALVNAGPVERRKMLEKILYPLVMQLEPEMASKVTDMLLELDTDEVLYLLESPEDLKDIVADAMEVLRTSEEQTFTHERGLPSALANAGPVERREMLEENLYPLVMQLVPEMAPKVTDLLLELDTDEVLYLLDSPEAFEEIVGDVLEVLRNFAQEHC